MLYAPLPEDFHQILVCGSNHTGTKKWYEQKVGDDKVISFQDLKERFSARHIGMKIISNRKLCEVRYGLLV